MQSYRGYYESKLHGEELTEREKQRMPSAKVSGEIADDLPAQDPHVVDVLLNGFG
jgi:hypothetical protein